jgi:hypothetical protein
MTQEKRYLAHFLEPIQKCKEYRPKFGDSHTKQGISLNEFSKLYGSDPFYSWIGLDSELMYIAHRVASGMTSVYRQLGIGCESLFRQIIIDTAGYKDPSSAKWSYVTKTKTGKEKKLSLDARLELQEIQNLPVLSNVNNWISAYCGHLHNVPVPQNGIVFEVRQGYKSKDSQRQTADIDNATVAWANGYLPVFALFSAKIDADIVLRYYNNRCGMIIGSNSADPKVSLFAFCKEILGYDLAGFFEKNSAEIKTELHSILNSLLSAK